jgi:hypothetical protein
MHELAYGNKPSKLVASMQWKQCIFVVWTPRHVWRMENGEHVVPIERYHIMDVMNWTQ